MSKLDDLELADLALSDFKGLVYDYLESKGYKTEGASIYPVGYADKITVNIIYLDGKEIDIDIHLISLLAFINTKINNK